MSRTKLAALKLPPAVEAEIPENDEAAAEYYGSHSIANLMTDAEWLERPQPVGVQEIAQRAGVQQGTVRKWRERHQSFPRPCWSVSGQPAWDWHDVEVWLRKPRRAGRPALGETEDGH